MSGIVRQIYEKITTPVQMRNKEDKSYNLELKNDTKVPT